jgi:hypothetical protein
MKLRIIVEIELSDSSLTGVDAEQHWAESMSSEVNKLIPGVRKIETRRVRKEKLVWQVFYGK